MTRFHALATSRGRLTLCGRVAPKDAVADVPAEARREPGAHPLGPRPAGPPVRQRCRQCVAASREAA
jgi:hypothetical protein